MPIFEFKCEKCGEQFEKLVFSSDCRDIQCPSCGCSGAKKTFSVFSCGPGIPKSMGSSSCGGGAGGGGSHSSGGFS